MASIEEKVEEHYKKILDELGIRHYGKTESINRTITDALRSADSKSGGSGNNYPDIQLLLENKTARRIPVMIEAKGLKNRLEKISKSGQIELITYYEKDSKRKDGTIQHHAGDANYSSIMNYAVNGAVHYANAILDSRGYTEVIAIGINGTQMNADGSVQDAECRAYYISEKNNRVPKHIPELDKEWSLLKADNLDRFFAMLDKMTLTEKELEDLRQRTETALETKIKSIHQSLYDDPKLRTALTTNEKLYLFCGLIMVGLTTKGVAPLDVNQFTGNDDQEDNDSTIIITRIRSFLKKKKCGDDKIRMILDLLQPVFKKETLWRPVNGESILKSLFKQVKQDIIPCLESNLHLDFTGKILNSLGDWVHIENDRENDVVLTPRYVTTLMAKLARTNMDSFVWDRAMGSAGFLVSAMDIMIKDAQAKIHDQKELEKKITNIKEHQLLGVEILGNIYILAVLNMILMGDGSSNIYNGDGHDYNNETGKFPATVFLLNPPYSADGKGFNFVQEALEKMTSGYACILIQENAGSGNGLPYTKKILEKNTLCASVHMSDTFQKGKFITPINAIPLTHELEDEKSWTYGRMPEYLWIGLILKYYGRDEGLRKSYGIISALHKLAPGLYTARLSQILKLDADIQKRFYDYIICSGAKEALAPLTVFLTASKAPVFAKCFYCPDQSVEDRCEAIIQTMREIMDHQSNEATDIRFVALYFNQLSGEVHLLREQVDLLVAYPSSKHTDEIMCMARPTVRSLEMMILTFEEVDSAYLKEFWRCVSEMTDCSIFAIRFSEEKRNITAYMEKLHEVFVYLS